MNAPLPDEPAEEESQDEPSEADHGFSSTSMPFSRSIDTNRS